jgi:hypothetical protein
MASLDKFNSSERIAEDMEALCRKYAEVHASNEAEVVQ